METKDALLLAYAALVISLISLALVALEMLYHIGLPNGAFKVLAVLGYIWPAAAYCIANFRKKLAAEGKL